jgi:hypothetical protein
VAVSLKYRGNGAGNTVQARVASGCASQGSTAIPFHADQDFGSQTTTGDNYFISTLSTLTMTGCAANDLLVLRFSRADTDGILKLAAASISFDVP